MNTILTIAAWNAAHPVSTCALSVIIPAIVGVLWAVVERWQDIRIARRYGRGWWMA